jgi:hypothetical protein
MKNGTHGYLDCIVRCGRGFRCKHRSPRAGPGRCTLLCAADGHDRMRSPLILGATQVREPYHASR